MRDVDWKGWKRFCVDLFSLKKIGDFVLSRIEKSRPQFCFEF